MAGHGADGDGMPLALANAFKELGDVLSTPLGMTSLPDDDVCGLPGLPVLVFFKGGEGRR